MENSVLKDLPKLSKQLLDLAKNDESIIKEMELGPFVKKYKG